MLLFQHHGGARAVLYAAVVIAIGAEIIATYVGRARAGDDRGVRALGSSAAEATVLRRRAGGPGDRDRGTKWVLVGATLLGLIAALELATHFPALRAGANTWATLVAGAAIVCIGALVRAWAILTLGRFFRREVTIEAGQTVVRSGPYRFVRHPSYTGNLLTAFGFGLAFGSWVGAIVWLAIALAGHVPRILVEERELAAAFGDSYGEHARATARLVPGVW